MKRFLAAVLVFSTLNAPLLAHADSFSTCPAETHHSFLGDLGGDLQSIFGKAKSAGESLGDGFGAFFSSAKDHIFDGAAQLVGYTELLGIRYPVTNYQFEVSPTLTRGSRQDAAGIADLGQRGFKSIVDLTREGTNDGPAARAAGMNTWNVPTLDNDHPTEAQMKGFLDFVTNPANQPAYIHCEAGKGRTGIATAVYRMAVQGWPLDQTMAEAEKFGMSLPNQQAFVRQFAADLAAGKIAGYPQH